MKANKTTLSVRELQKMLGQWKKRKVTNSTKAKLLKLYLGMTAYMNDERVYPIEKFYGISSGLRFKNTRCMTQAIRQCGSFGIIPADNAYGMSAFYSPIWGDEKALVKGQINTDTKSELPEQISGTLPGTLPGTFPTDDIYNNITPKGDDAEKAASSEEKTEAVKSFFHLVNETPEEKAQILTPLIKLKNLLKSTHAQHLLNDAARAGRLKREKDIGFYHCFYARCDFRGRLKNFLAEGP